MNCKGPYTVLAFNTFEHSEKDSQNGGGYACDWQCETLKEAKSRAKYLLSEQYRVSAEMSECFQYVQVQDASGDIVADFFGKVAV